MGFTLEKLVKMDDKPILGNVKLDDLGVPPSGNLHILPSALTLLVKDFNRFAGPYPRQCTQRYAAKATGLGGAGLPSPSKFDEFLTGA